MDETSFDIDSTQLAETSLLFPAHRLAPTSPRPHGEIARLASSADTAFARDAWDEGGRF